MLRNRILCLSYICVLFLTIYTVYKVNNVYSLNIIENNILTYSPNMDGVSVYELTDTPNMMKCNLTTVNNIIESMIAEDYYYIVQDLSDNEVLDITLYNDNEYHRILYNRDSRSFVNISDNLIKSYIPITYINGKE